MEAMVGGMSAGLCSLRGSGPALTQIASGAIRCAVMPGRLHQQPAGMSITGLGDPTLDPTGPRGVLTGHQTQVGADRTSRQPTPIADLDGQPPNAVNVEIPRKQPSLCTTGVNSLSAAIAVIAASSRLRRSTQASIASNALS